MSFEFLAATEEEILNLNISNEKELNDSIEMMFRYGVCGSGLNNYRDIEHLSNFFMQSEDYAPKKILRKFTVELKRKRFTIKYYQFDNKFIEEVAKIDYEELNSPKAVEYWQSRGYFSMGTWSAIFGFYNLCKFAIKDKKNVYLWEEINESALEK